MDKRVLTTVVICMAIVIAYQKFFMPSPPPQQQQQQQATEAQNAQNAPAAAANAPAANSPTAPTATANSSGAKSPTAETAKTGEAAKPEAAKTGESKPEAPKAEAVKPPAEIANVERPGLYRAAFTSWGAAPTEWTLLKPQYQETRARDEKKDLRPINLVRTGGAALPLMISFPQSDFVLPDDAAWKPLPAPSPDELVYGWDDERVHVEKHYTFSHSYDFTLMVTVENKSDKPISEHFQLSMYGWQDPSVKPGGMFSQRFIQTAGLCHVNNKLRSSDFQALLSKPHDEIGQVRFIGYDEKYFLAAAALKLTGEDRRCTMGATPDGTVAAKLVTAEQRIEPKQKYQYELTGYFGPKTLAELDAVRVGGTDPKLGDAVNYGWTEVLARPMLAVLKAVHAVIPNWGFAVIVLTILLKAITWWPTTKSMKSMKAMAKLKPEMDRLKEKYGEDKQRMNLEVMNLYKQHGINPLGGCLPMLIQMPIYIALYSMLGNSVELYRSGFVGWIRDLTSPDPYYVLPLLTGALMFAQQKFSPQSPDAQQKMMMYTMPVMFTAFSIFLPAGLTVYILSNTLLSIGQQWWLNRQDPRTVLAKPAKA